ncbi:MAG: HD domain-containing protein [Solirubrobacterales bacterium]
MQDIAEFLKYEDVYGVLMKYSKCQGDTHEKKVILYAGMIADSLDEVFTFSSEERNLLLYSAILHDIGRYIGKKSHHKHTSYIINNDETFNAVPSNLRAMLALVAAGHRKALGKALSDYNLEEKEVIQRLASVLRLSDALDHTHCAEVTINNIQICRENLIIYIKGRDSVKITNKAMEKADLFKESFNMDVKIIC